MTVLFEDDGFELVGRNDQPEGQLVSIDTDDREKNFAEISLKKQHRMILTVHASASGFSDEEKPS
ncbi:MAG: hypothetical protein J0G33_09110 [Afipia felis]|jgi:hypothetical protein|uniref:hypothetical protein n=1 Tax=Hyphomicrobiales TaxID=356 RepID=UPI0011C37629|nr:MULTISPECIES: hypothetical protein [Hyphomicrobiales]MBN9603076.1 hypothetical protein [Afipia felis]MBX9821815.1 hypothetical protein [Afipia birgiae]MCA3566497.1 hypothetical protein [Bradyrhizobium sp.]MCA3579355.1 hypothetical protein [Bradyrhizobium sp.]